VLKEKIHQLGIDKAISFTLAGRLTQALGSIVSIILIGTFLDSNEQGYFYTFGSILAIQIFFELGLTNIITQYVAHEKAMLNWNGNTLVGPYKSLSRLASIFQLTVKWYSFIAILLLAVLMVTGFIYFQKFSEENITIYWRFPWVLLVCSSSILLLMTAIIAFYEGLEKAEECAKIRMFQQLIQITTLIFALLLGAKLYSAGISMLISSIFVMLWVSFSKIRPILIYIWKSYNDTNVIDWKKEVLPYQWRIAVSWMSGYFIFQLFNPILFATQGAIVAGQMGMTMAVIQGTNSMANAWFKTKIPTFSILIAQKKFIELNVFYYKTLKQSLFALFGATFLLTMILLFLYRQKLGIVHRFLPFVPVLLLMGTSFLQLLLDAMATYLRCHKKEPFLALSIAMGILTSITLYLVSKPYGVTGITFSYFIILLMATIWGYRIFNLKKNKWHE